MSLLQQWLTGQVEGQYKVRSERLEQMAAAYCSQTDIPPDQVELVEETKDGKQTYYFRRRALFNPATPIYLELYPYAYELMKWACSGKPEEERKWLLDSTRNTFRCVLQWRTAIHFRTITHYSKSAESAVNEALRVYKREVENA